MMRIGARLGPLVRTAIAGIVVLLGWPALRLGVGHARPLHMEISAQGEPVSAWVLFTVYGGPPRQSVIQLRPSGGVNRTADVTLPHVAREVEIYLRGPSSATLLNATWPSHGIWKLPGPVVFERSPGEALVAHLGNIQPAPFWLPGRYARVALIFLFLGLVLLFDAFAGTTLSGLRTRRAVWALRYAAAPFVAWFVWWLSFFPGLISWDPLYQLQQIVTHDYNDWHPATHTFLIWLLSRGSGSFGPLTFAHFSLTALLLGLCLASLRRLGASGLPCLLASFAAALSPCFGLESIAAWKDTSFAISVLWASLLLLRSLEERTLSRGRTAQLALAAASLSLLRHPGALTALWSFIAFGFTFPADRRRVVGAAAASICLVLAVRGPIFKWVDVAPPPALLVEHSIIHDIQGMLVRGARSSAGDLAVLESLLPLSVWNQSYQCFSSNRILFHSGLRAGEADKHSRELPRIWLHLLAQNPLGWVQHRLCVTGFLWNPLDGTFAIGPLSDDGGTVDAPNRWGVENESFIPALRPWLARLALKSEFGSLFSRALIWSPATGLYLLLLGLAAATLRSRSMVPLLILGPALVSTVVFLGLSSSPEIRFQWQTELLAPLAACLPFCSPSRLQRVPPSRVARDTGARPSAGSNL